MKLRFNFIALALICTLTWAIGGPGSSVAQVLSAEIQNELARNNLTEAEARTLAVQLGINLDDPVQAVQRARELGVSEALISRMLRAVSSAENAAGEPDGSIVPDSTNTGVPDIIFDAAQMELARARRDSLNASETEVPLQDRGNDELRRFGYDVFQNAPDAFEPGPSGPISDNYIVAPGDELRLVIWGASEFQYTLPVDADGRIFVQRVGQILVAGKRLSDLRNDIKQTLSRSYAGLVSDPPSVYMDLTVTRLRSVKVFVLGEVGQPGGYTVPSGSSIFNVLYSMGGPLERGSLRSIDVVRDGEMVSRVDLYQYLLRGFADNPVQLQDNDVVFVRPRGTTVTIAGEVGRPAIYELADGEQFTTLLDYAGGLTSSAYTKRYQIERIVPFAERTDPSIARVVLDLSLSDEVEGRASTEIRDGDIVRVFEISDRIRNAVTVAGAVFQPGRYELSSELATVRDLLLTADGLKEDAFTGSASLVRVRDDFSDQQITLDLERVMADDPTQNIPLLRMDSLTVYSRMDVQAEGEVSISGYVRQEQTMPWRDNLLVKDLLFAGGGLYDSLYVKTVFLERADIFRLNEDGYSTRVIPFNLEQALAGNGSANERLRPGDEIKIYPRSVSRIEGERVYITGAVKSPGLFEFRDGLTLEDLIMQAGGFTSTAYLRSAEVSRNVYGEQQISSTETVLLAGGLGEADRPDSDDALTALTAARAVVLQPEDRVFVRTDPSMRPQESILVSGEVRFPGNYAIEYENESLESIVERAGGLLPTGYSGGARLIRGSQPIIADFDKIFAGGDGHDITVLPGDQLFVPRSPNTVEVRGNVNNPGLIIFDAGSKARDYIDKAGGLGPETADIFVTQANGATVKLRKGLFPSNPRVDEGGIISVTMKVPKEPGEGTDVGKILSDSLSILITLLPAIIVAANV